MSGSCSKCSSGKYSQNGINCSYCPSNSGSSSGAASCDCYNGYYMSGSSCYKSYDPTATIVIVTISCVVALGCCAFAIWKYRQRSAAEDVKNPLLPAGSEQAQLAQFCYNCGTPRSVGGAVFCTHCGKALMMPYSNQRIVNVQYRMYSESDNKNHICKCFTN